MSYSNCCFLTCIQVSQEAGQGVWYSHLFQNVPQFIVIHTVKGFGIVNKAERDVFLELCCFFNDPADVGNLISGSSAFSKTSLNIWKFTVHVWLKPNLGNFEHYSGVPAGSEVKASASNSGDLGSIPGLGRSPLEKEMVTHSSILAWRIPWTEEPGRLQSMELQRVRHDWATSLPLLPLTSVWDECNCVVVWAFFGIAFLWDWNENWPFPILWPLLTFPNLLAYWVQHFHSIIFQDLK